MQKIEKLTAVLHSTDNQPSNKHVRYAEDRSEILYADKSTYFWDAVIFHSDFAMELFVV